MQLNISELELLLKGLSNLGGNNENWELQDRIIKQINWLEKCNNEKKELTGFKELDFPEMP